MPTADTWNETVDRNKPAMPTSELHGEPLLEVLLNPTSPEHAWAVWAARDYWTPGRFTGGEFDRLGLGHRGIDPNPDVITATDVAAVSMLGVDIPALTTLDILGPKAIDNTRLLSRIPDRPLHEVELADVQTGSPALDLWHLIRNRDQKMGRTKTSKLLARKRPHLLPIFDSRVQSRLNLPDQDWAWWWTWWNDPNHVKAVTDLRNAASVPHSMNWTRDISLLRIVDVIVWRYDVAWNPKRRRAAGDEGGVKS